MQLSTALPIAEKYQALLSPYCLPDRCVIAGSIRRKKANVNDIEIVCIPLQVTDPGDMFCQSQVIHPGFADMINSLQKIRGEPDGKYTRRALPEGIEMDIFIATPENWGNILAIRTGPADYSHNLAKRWVELGYMSSGGILYKGIKKYPCPTEQEFYKLLGLEWQPPEKRGL